MIDFVHNYIMIVSNFCLIYGSLNYWTLLLSVYDSYFLFLSLLGMSKPNNHANTMADQ